MTISRTKLMLVDDDKDILQSLKKGLETRGFEVHGFSDSIQALDHIERNCSECKAIISDIRMPNINGFQLVHRVKELHPEMKVIMVSALEVNVREFEAVLTSTPIDDVIKKPFPPSKLAERITQLLPTEKAR